MGSRAGLGTPARIWRFPSAKVAADVAFDRLCLDPADAFRVVKLLKNPHFMAKPAAIDLIRSIIQVRFELLLLCKQCQSTKTSSCVSTISHVFHVMQITLHIHLTL